MCAKERLECVLGEKIECVLGRVQNIVSCVIARPIYQLKEKSENMIINFQKSCFLLAINVCHRK